MAAVSGKSTAAEVTKTSKENSAAKTSVGDLKIQAAKNREEENQAFEIMTSPLTIKQFLRRINIEKEIYVNLKKLRTEDLTEENIQKILDSLKKSSHTISLTVSNREITTGNLRKILFNLVFQKKELFRFRLDNIPLDTTVLQSFGKLPIKHLALTGCQVDTDNLQLLVQNPDLEELIIQEIIPGNVSLIAVLINILKENRFSFLDFSPNNTLVANVTEKDKTDLLQAFIQNTSIRRFENLCYLFNMSDKISEIRTKRKEREKSLKPLTFLYFHYKNQKIEKVGSQPELDSTIEKLSGSELRKALYDLQFNPNSVGFGFGDNNPYINSWIACERYEEVTKMIRVYSKEIDFTMRDWQGKTALIAAAKTAVPRKIKFPSLATADDVILAMLDTKNDLEINAQDDLGCTALHYLALYKRAHLFLLLLQAGANPNIADNKGRTPLDYCLNLTVQEQRHILFYMVINPDRDISANFNNLFGHLARMKNTSSITSLLQKYGSLSPVANLNTLETIKADILANGEAHIFPDFLRNYSDIENSISGVSIIEACNDINAINIMKKLINEHNGVSYLQAGTFLGQQLSVIGIQFEEIVYFQNSIQAATNLGALGGLILQFSDLLPKTDSAINKNADSKILPPIT